MIGAILNGLLAGDLATLDVVDDDHERDEARHRHAQQPGIVGEESGDDGGVESEEYKACPRPATLPATENAYVLTHSDILASNPGPALARSVTILGRSAHGARLTVIRVPHPLCP